MIEYAKVSKIVEYAVRRIWPNANPERVNREVPLLSHLKQRIKSLLVKSQDKNFKSEQDLVLNALRSKRYWEYPWVLEQLEALPSGAKILDCGCGKARFAGELHRRGYQSSGLDFFIGKKRSWGIDNDTIRKYRGRVNFINGSMEQIPCEDNYFDGVTCISVMEHIVIDQPEHAKDPKYHLICLDEMKRVLRHGGLLVCTYDTFIDPKLAHAGTPEWGATGWNYLDDIDYLGMTLKDPNAKRVTLHEISVDEDAYFVPPDLYFARGFSPAGKFFCDYKRLTSVGFCLVK
jgi:ubiquinone/menaquinone biosynthesis C-methylase UbiE